MCIGKTITHILEVCILVTFLRASQPPIGHVIDCILHNSHF